ncbi:hypothetical protein OsI_16409 [Oryza sativa Indica Group]|uniref:DUF7358 domain-containing protein n=1 Tax=Oryza sativa subsp. indica TaxID=39946 RepID=B8AVU4_ORYSI|nr:hypothetical protein OsI_16409 [Oryza sativa Indica Group]
MRPPFRIRGVRRMSAALAAVNVAVAAAGAAAEWVGVTERCGRREEAAVGAAVALAAVRIVAMVGTARAQEVTALAVVSAGGSWRRRRGADGGVRQARDKGRSLALSGSPALTGALVFWLVV